MKRYIQEYLKLTLPRIDQEAEYDQKIKTQTIIKGVTKKQLLKRQFKVGIQPMEYSDFKVAFQTKKIKIQLDSTLKKQERLSSEIAGVLDSVVVKMNRTGLFTEILNHDEIVAKWYRLKPILVREFKGNAFLQYLSGIEQKFEDPVGLLHDMRQYRNYGLVFNELLVEHSNVEIGSSSRNRTIDTIFYERSVAFRETMIFDKIVNNVSTLVITGSLNDTLSPSEVSAKKLESLTLDANAVFKLNAYKGTYQFQTETGLLEHMKLAVNTSFGQQYQKDQQYSLNRIN